MANVPQKPEDIFADISGDYENVFGNDLLSVILYGSGAKGDYKPKKSDLNFLIILNDTGIQQLAKSFDLIKKYRKYRVDVPLFLTPDYIRSSLDSFPIEFLNITRAYKVAYGEDVFKDIEIPKKFLRLQCEEQIKGKLLHLREAFLRTLGKKRALRSMIKSTIPAFSSIFTAMLALKDVPPPAQKRQVYSKTAEIFDLDTQVFDAIWKVVENREKMNKTELITLAQRYIQVIRQCAFAVDQL
ncbi:hypothetical protein GF407_20300 [candidate division KSB1 bacterium]|nr:hypothetical protein [candidate division KSB1 bacterium]